MPEDQFKRYIAYKLRIKDIISSNYIKSENFTNYISFNGQEISRFNVIGVVLDKSSYDNYENLVIDDGTGRIFARTFGSNSLLDKIKPGEVVMIIGRPREFSSERYILIEIIKKIDSLWAKARKLELAGNVYSDNNSLEENNRYLNDTKKNKIIKIIRDLDKGDGVSAEDVASNPNYSDEIIETLLKEGGIFEIKPGKLKVLE